LAIQEKSAVKNEKRKRRFGSDLNLQCTDDDNYHDDNLQFAMR